MRQIINLDAVFSAQALQFVLLSFNPFKLTAALVELLSKSLVSILESEETAILLL
jgi:hypothetical protein